MQAWLAFLAGVLMVIGAIMIVFACSGIAYYGLAVQIEAAISIVLLVSSAILTWLFYKGVKAQYKKIKTGKEALIGALGVVTTPLTPKGEIRVEGEFWQATSRNGEIPSGQTVQVVDMDGMFLVVQPTMQKA
jgi:membrane-bound serine protease (ClpP class)